MEAKSNPFKVSGYHGEELFCDRKEETKRLVSNVMNGIHSTIISVRRMGKTGLIQHVYNTLSRKKNIYSIYFDIYSTQNQKDFTSQLSTAILRAFPKRKTLADKVLDFIKGLRPVLSYDQYSGQPEVSLDYASNKQNEQSLSAIINFLESQGLIFVIAIDEFQQIDTYPEKNTEALLRTLIQPLKNIRFIFSGSSKHTLNQIFNSSKRPFFASTQMIELGSIDEDLYKTFIEKTFKKHNRKITQEALDFITYFTKLHTYYTQVLCNRIFASGYKTIQVQDVLNCCSQLLKEQESTFFQYRSLLTKSQWQLLKGIAIEDKLYKPTAKEFIHKNKLGTPSHVQRALEALMTKEMIYKEKDDHGNYYRVYDCFLARWLEKY